jgi:hypothetical protein
MPQLRIYKMRLGKEAMRMKSYTHACIAYIVGRLIAGKDVTSIYDYARSCEIDITGLPDERCLKSFSCINWSFMTHSPHIFRYQFSCKAGHLIDLSVKGNTFIGYVRDNASHFMGKVTGDAVYLYDQEKATHFNYRISGNALSH